MTRHVAARLSSALELLEAIDRGELRMHHQAIFRLPDLEIVGFEALLRWEHPSRGLLRPPQFLPEDMDGGLGWALTNFALEEAVRACAGWQADGMAAGVSVNVSPGWFGDPFLADHLGDLLRRFGLAASWLTVELTEHASRARPETLRQAASVLRGLGVRISLDDFGTGASTLLRLRELDVDEIKIDRCFVAGAAGGGIDGSIVRFAADLGTSIGLSVVAEGVEDQHMLEAARAAGVGLAQGFHLHRPEPFVPGHAFPGDATIWL